MYLRSVSPPPLSYSKKKKERKKCNNKFPQFLDGKRNCGIDNWMSTDLGYKLLSTLRQRNFALKTYQMLSVHTSPVEFKNAPISGRFRLVFKNLGQRNYTIIGEVIFFETSFVKILTVQTKTKSRRLQLSSGFLVFDFVRLPNLIELNLRIEFDWVRIPNV